MNGSTVELVEKELLGGAHRWTSDIESFRPLSDVIASFATQAHA